MLLFFYSEETKETTGEEDELLIVNERVEALNHPLKRSFIEKEDESDNIIDDKLLVSYSISD